MENLNLRTSPKLVRAARSGSRCFARFAGGGTDSDEISFSEFE
jgi:hypothetical protein